MTIKSKPTNKNYREGWERAFGEESTHPRNIITKDDIESRVLLLDIIDNYCIEYGVEATRSLLKTALDCVALRDRPVIKGVKHWIENDEFCKTTKKIKTKNNKD